MDANNETLKKILAKCSSENQNADCVKLSGKASKEDKEKLVDLVGKKLFDELSEIVDVLNTGK